MVLILFMQMEILEKKETIYINKFFPSMKKNKGNKITDEDEEILKSEENRYNNNNINPQSIVTISQNYEGSLLTEKVILTDRSEIHARNNSLNPNILDIISNSLAHPTILPLMNDQSNHKKSLLDKTNRNNKLLESVHKVDNRQEENSKNRKSYQIPILLNDVSPKIALKKNSQEYSKQSDSSKSIKISAYSPLHGREYVHKSSKLRKRDIEIVHDVYRSHNLSKNSVYPNPTPKINSSLLKEKNERIYHPGNNITYQKTLAIPTGVEDESSIGDNSEFDQRVGKLFTRSEAYVIKNKIGLIKTLKNLEEISKQNHEDEADIQKLPDVISVINSNDKIINKNKHLVLPTQNYIHRASNSLNVPNNNKLYNNIPEIMQNGKVVKGSSRNFSKDSPEKKFIV